jgi:hypothetical protein
MNGPAGRRDSDGRFAVLLICMPGCSQELVSHIRHSVPPAKSSKNHVISNAESLAKKHRHCYAETVSFVGLVTVSSLTLNTWIAALSLPPLAVSGASQRHILQSWVFGNFS